MIATPSDIPAIARKWSVSPRTVYNWKRRGINLANDAAIIAFIAGSKKATPAQLAAAADILAMKLP